MFWIIQGLGIVVLILTIVSFLQKEKWKMFICFSLTNAFLIPIYILSGSLLGGLLVAGAFIKSIFFAYSNAKNKRPSFELLSVFITYYILIAIVIDGSLKDMLLLSNLLVLSFTSWQNDLNLLRSGYVLSSILLAMYDVLLGAYTAGLSEIVMFVMALALIFRHRKSVYTDIAKKWYEMNHDFWKISICENDDCLVVSSSIDDCAYYNVSVLKDYKILKQEKNSLVYVSYDDKSFNKDLNDAYILQMCFPVVFKDTYMKLIDGFNMNNTKCKIQGVRFERVVYDKIDDVIKVFVEGYLSKTKKDKLTKNEKSIIEHLRNFDFSNDKLETKINVYVAYFNSQPVSMVFSLTKDRETFFAKVSTLPIFRRKHIASSLIQYAIKEERKKGTVNFYVVTDADSSNNKFYNFNNFTEIGRGMAFDVSDINVYNRYLETGKIEVI